MKTTSILILVLLAFNFSIAQNNLLIKHRPQNTDGYIVMQNPEGISVNYWEIEVIQNTYENFELTDQEIVYSYNVMGRDYHRIPEEFFNNDNMTVRLNAILNDGTVLTQNDVLTNQVYGGPQYEYAKSFKCNGSTYAYEISQFNHKTNGTSYLRVDPTAEKHNPVTWYYQYYSDLAWPNIQTNPNAIKYYPPGYPNNTHNLQPLSIQEYHNLPSANFAVDGGNIIKIESPNKTYYDGQGNPITSNTIFGIRKHLGPWSYTGLQTPYLFTNAFTDLYDAIFYINAYANPVDYGMEPLTCDQPTSPYNPFPVNLGNSFHWFDSVIRIIRKDFMNEILEDFDNMADLGLNTSNSPYSGLSIYQLTGQGNLVSYLGIDDIFTPEGESKNVPIILSAGLYCYIIHFDDGSFVRIIDEHESDSYNPNTMANNFSVTIFPVPITENSFSMNMQASQGFEISFTYVLYDFNGNNIYTTDILIEEGETGTYFVNPDYNIPSGHLVNVFYFTDGSQMSILTVKNNP